MGELDHWRTKIAPITVQDWVSKKVCRAIWRLEGCALKVNTGRNPFVDSPRIRCVESDKATN